MPNDIRLNWDNALMKGDFVIVDSDLEDEDGLETAVLVSLFTDRRARSDDTLPDPNSNDRRGWCGDLASPDVVGDQIGSRLWLLERSKTIDEVLVQAKTYIKEALQWMIEDGVAVKIGAEAERHRREVGDVLALTAIVYETYGVKRSVRFEYLWRGTGDVV